MNIKCPYCKGVSEADTIPEVGEALQCPYCARTFQFGQKISKPTRVEIPMRMSRSKRSAATKPIAPQSVSVVRGRSVSRSNFARTNSRPAGEKKKSEWLHDHIAIVVGIGGSIIVGLTVAVVALLFCDSDGRIEVVRNPEAVKAVREKMEMDDHIVNVSSAVTNDVVQDGESAKKDVVNVEQLKAVPIPPNNEHVGKYGDFSTPDEKVDGNDFASNATDADKDPFSPDSAADDEDSFRVFLEKKSDGANDAPRQMKKVAEEKQSVIASSKKKTYLDREEIKSEYATLTKEHAVLAKAILQLDMIPDPGRAVYSLRQFFENYSLSNVYDKWSGNKWNEFSTKTLREIEETDRKYQLPPRTPEAKGANSRERLVDAKKSQEGLESKLPKDARKGAFAEIIASIKIRIEEDALKPLKEKLEVQRVAYTEVVEEGKREAAEKKRRKEEARKAARKKMEPIYEEMKAWYEEQLNYNGLSESYFEMYLVGYGPAANLTFTDAMGSTLQINIAPVNNKRELHLEWPRSMPQGFAQKLIESRIMIYKFEHPTWEKDLEEKSRRQAEEARRQAEEEKKNSYKPYTPKKRRINPDLKRFKRKDRFSR